MNLSRVRKAFKGITIKKLIFTVIGSMLSGMDVAFAAAAGLGNDPVGILYDGLRAFLGLSQSQLSIATNLINLGLIIFVFFMGRHYVNVGTVICLVTYGLGVDVGNLLYSFIFPSEMTLKLQITAVAIGLLFLYSGLGMEIASDIGIDSTSGFIMVIRDRTHWQYRTAKIVCDLCSVAAGFLLGGKLGVVTVLCAVINGPMIQIFTKIFKKVLATERSSHVRDIRESTEITE